jgi:hypothetical protein
MESWSSISRQSHRRLCRQESVPESKEARSSQHPSSLSRKAPSHHHCGTKLKSYSYAPVCETQSLHHSSDSDRNSREGRSHTDHPAGIRSCRRNLQIVDPSNGKGRRHFEKDIKSRSRTPTSSTTWRCYKNSQNMSTSLLDAWVVMRRRLKFCKVSSSYVLCPGLTSRRHNYTCAASLLHIGLATPQHALDESSELDRVEIGCTSTRPKSNSVQGSRFYALLGHTARRRSIPLLESCRFIIDMVRQLVIRYTCEGWPHCSPHHPTPNPLPAPLPTVLRADVGL